MRRGWAIWDGPSCTNVTSVVMFGEDLLGGASTTKRLRPVIAIDNDDDPIWMTDTTNTDNGTSYSAQLTTRPLIPSTMLNKFGVEYGAIVANPLSSVDVGVKLKRDMGLEIQALTADLQPLLTVEAVETQVFRVLDGLEMSEARSVQVVLVDGSSVGRWEVNQVFLKIRAEQKQ